MLLAPDFNIGFNTTHPLAIHAWKQHAADQFPNEAVGLVMNDGSFVALENVHAQPRDFFSFDEAELIARDGLIAGIVHSHTPGWEDDPTVKPSLSPSRSDMAGQIATDLPWGLSTVTPGGVSDPIWWGDSLPIRPLIGRSFIHGIMDCFSLIRDWHRLQGIEFEDVPRDPDWWHDPDLDLYSDLFESRGFKRVQRVAPKVGDGFICSLRSDKRNHAGIFVTPQMFLHHPGDMLSLRSQAARWQSKLDFLLRHKDLPEED